MAAHPTGSSENEKEKIITSFTEAFITPAPMVFGAGAIWGMNLELIQNKERYRCIALFDRRLRRHDMGQLGYPARVI